MNNLTTAPAAPLPEVYALVEDLCRNINKTQDEIIRVGNSVQALIGNYPKESYVENAFETFRGSENIPNALARLSSSVHGLYNQIQQQANILEGQVGSGDGYFIPQNQSCKPSSTNTSY